MMSKENINEIIEELKRKLNLDGRKRVFEDNYKLKSEFLIERSDPEAFTKKFLLERIFRLLDLEELPEKHFYLWGKRRVVDYRVENPMGNKILIEAKPINSDLYEETENGAVNQIKGLFKLAEAKEEHDFGIATDGLKWIFIDKSGQVANELDIRENFDKIEEFILVKKGVKLRIKEEEISKKFYEWYNALLHGGRYKDYKNKIKYIPEKDCLVNNVISVKDLEDREQIAQVVVDRLIFIKFLQSKGIIDIDILKYISSLEEDIVTPKMKQLFFSVFNTPKQKRLDVDKNFKEIPYLNGSLFTLIDVEKKNPDYKIKAEILKHVIDFLDGFAFVHLESSDNKESLDPEILGYIFERAMTAVDRKGTGAYYTPKSITAYISANTIYPYIIARINKFLIEEKGYKKTELIKRMNDLFILPATTLSEIWKKIIREIKILDNACGSGAFLLTAANILFDLNKRISNKLGLKNPDISLKKIILTKNLYGVDINPNGIEIAKLRLWLWLVDSFDKDHIEPLPNIDYNLMRGNSLIGYVDIRKFKELKFTLNDFFQSEEKPLLDDLLEKRKEQIKKYKNAFGEEAKELKEKIEKINIRAKNLLDVNFFREFNTKIKISKEEFLNIKPFHWGFEFYEIFDFNKPEDERGFDIIIGNPPYGSKKMLSKEVKDFIVSIHKCIASRDTAEMFIEKSFNLLRISGYLGYIIPKPLTYITSWHQIRDFLSSKKQINCIVDASKAFKDVLLEQVIVCIKNSENKLQSLNIGDISNDEIRILGKINYKNLTERIYQIYLYGKYEELYNKINNGSEYSTKYFNIWAGIGGITPKLNKDRNGLLILKGKSIKRYGFAEDLWYVHESVPNKRDIKEHDEKRLVCQDIIAHITQPKPHIKIMANIVDKGILTHETVINFSKKGDMELETLLCILNSKLISWYVYRFIFNLSIRTMHYRPGYADYTPIKFPRNQKPFINLANEMISLKKRLNEIGDKNVNERIKTEEEIKRVDKKIDELVYKIYEISHEEQKIIEESLK